MPRGQAQGIDPIRSGSALHTRVMKTEALRQALDLHGFDAAIGGARRDEEKSRAKERMFSAPRRRPCVGPAPAAAGGVATCINTKLGPGETMRVFPLSNWTELDVWDYIRAEAIAVVPLYFAEPRPVVQRSGAWIMVDDERFPLQAGEAPELRSVRFRTLGCYPLTGAIELRATSLRRNRGRDGRGHHLGAPGAPDRRRRYGLHGAQEARRLLLMHAPAQTSGGRGVLRFLTCGSVDDGKSTLIGRLIYDAKLVFEDQLATLARDSRQGGSRGSGNRLRAAA